jgi:antitoxin CptB
MREVDLILGRFADAEVDAMAEPDLAAFEALLDIPDPVILAWVTGQEAVPDDGNPAFIRKLIAFHR